MKAARNRLNLVPALSSYLENKAMIICPNCNHQELQGALFCSECGAQLVFADARTTSAINAPTADFKPPAASSISPPTMPSAASAPIMLYLLETGKFIPIKDRTEFTLGRSSEGQPIMPDVDLTPFKAYENGVSRLHAVIRVNKNECYIMDLSSANGTYINGERLAPNVENRIKTDDVIAIGKIKMKLILNT